jgi:hypothetical protein
MYLFKPTAYANTAAVTSYSERAPVFGLQVSSRLGRNFNFNASAMLFSLTKTVDGLASTGFFASGPILTGDVDYYFARAAGFEMSIGAGLGATMAKVGMYNPTTASKVETSSIIGVLFLGKLGISRNLGKSFAFKLDGGYQLLSLKNVPYLAGALDADGTADFAMSAPFFGTSLQYVF